MLTILYTVFFIPAYSDTITTKVKAKDLPEELKNTEVKTDTDTSDDFSIDELKHKANDYKRAFRILKQQNPGGKFYIIVSGQSIDNLENIKVMPGGTLMMLDIFTNRGSQTRVINTSDVSEIGAR